MKAYSFLCVCFLAANLAIPVTIAAKTTITAATTTTAKTATSSTAKAASTSAKKLPTPASKSKTPPWKPLDCTDDRVCCTWDGVCACAPDEYERQDHQCVPITPKEPDGVKCENGVCEDKVAVLDEWQCHVRLVEPHKYVKRNCKGTLVDTATTYERCKATHRCNWARQVYKVRPASYTTNRISFDNGRIDDVALFNDFEDWYAGAHGYSHDSKVQKPIGHFHTFDPELPLLGPLDILSGHVIFNTSDATVTLTHDKGYGGVGGYGAAGYNSTGYLKEAYGERDITEYFTGKIRHTQNDTDVAIFNWDYIYLESGARVEVVGDRAFMLLSRSSIFINTTIDLPPGTIGGWPGQPYAHFNDANGPGSGSVRVYLFTVTTFTDDIDEIQTVTTQSRIGENLGGYFYLRLDEYTTARIRHDASPQLVKQRLEELPNINEVAVTRKWLDPDEFERGMIWTVQFTGAIGNVSQLVATSDLTGIGSRVWTNTLRDGNDLIGTFTLSFLGNTTRPMRQDVDADTMKRVLEADIPLINNANVTRTNPLNLRNCDYGYCPNGPTTGWGLDWTLSLTTHAGNVQPTSPTHPSIKTLDPFAMMTAQTSFVGTGSSISVVRGHTSLSRNNLEELYVRKIGPVFTLAFGGNGGSYGGTGGTPQGFNLPGFIYNDAYITDLIGGSAGAVGGPDLKDVLFFNSPRYEGGAGGGAMEIIAWNDFVIGPGGRLVADGAPGQYGFHGGGGGSGGAILLSAGTSVVNRGLVSTSGGAGGGCTKAGRVGGGGGGGRLAVYAQSLWNPGTIKADGGAGGTVQNNPVPIAGSAGANAPLQLDTAMGVSYHVDRQNGVFGTKHSLRLEGGEMSTTESDVAKVDPYVMNGPRVDLGRPRRPMRVSYYFMLSPPKRGTKENNWGAYFALHPPGWQDSLETMIGVAIVDGTFRHAANFGHTPGLTRLSSTTNLKRDMLYMQWYKVDFQIYWDRLQYDVYLDDEMLVSDAPFKGQGVQALGMYNYHHHTAWFDEIFVGRDDDQAFRCPIINASGLFMTRPMQSEWRSDYLTRNEDWEIIRHDSHVSRRPEYYKENNYGGLLLGDGGPHQFKFMSDFKVRPEWRAGVFQAGSFLFVPDAEKWGKSDFYTDGSVKRLYDGVPKGRYYWYGDHFSPSKHDPEGYMYGGVGACSSSDMIHWRNEGIQLHFVNISDQWGNLTEVFLAQRPKVLYNDNTGKYIMWMHVEDNRTRNYGAAAVATANYPNGPFHFHRTFYPDGNKTKDLNVYKNKKGEGFLLRTYFADVDYYLPQPVMQPMWESVKDSSGDIDFALNYHRAFYAPEYDDYHDIFQQRSRKEDINWDIRYYHKLTRDCFGVCGGPAVLDECGVCGGRGDSDACKPGKCLPQDLDCAGKCKGTALEDQCGVCNGDNSTCIGRTPTCPDKVLAYREWSPVTFPERWFYSTDHNVTVLEKNNALFHIASNQLPTVSYLAFYMDCPMPQKHPGVNCTRSIERSAGEIRADLHTACCNGVDNDRCCNLFDRHQAHRIDLLDVLIDSLEVKNSCPCPFLEVPENLGDDKLGRANVWRHTDTIDQCAARCKNRQGCTGFEWKDQRGKNCGTYIESLSTLRREERTGDLKWFSCVLPAEVPPQCQGTVNDGGILIQDFRAAARVRENEPVRESQSRVPGMELQNARILRAGVGYNFSRDLHTEVIGQGAFSGAVDSRFIDPANKTNSYWLPSSVPAVKAQPWYRNYMDGNVADNPLHPTVPDKLIGPQTRTNTRRTKYIAVTRLTSDYLQTTGQTRTFEGDLEDNKDLIDLIMQFGQFNWSPDGDKRDRSELGPGVVPSTDPQPVYARYEEFNLHTAPDWFDRLHQFRQYFNDRINDPVNFANEITEGHI